MSVSALSEFVLAYKIFVSFLLERDVLTNGKSALTSLSSSFYGAKHFLSIVILGDIIVSIIDLEMA